MAPDGLTRAVRRRLGLGRLLPLGEASDGAWLAEKAADSVLRQAAAEVAGLGVGVSLGRLRIGLADPDTAAEPAVPPPPGALPPGPLRIEADFTATAVGEPLPHRAERLRIALREAASARLGLAVTAVDLRVTHLVEAAQELVATTGPDEGNGGEYDDSSDSSPPQPVERQEGPEESGPVDRAAAAAAAVPGVARLTRTLGAPVQHTDGHLRVELATAAGHRALAVAVAVRRAVAASQDDRPTVAVLVTRVE
ncbi:hypothetical protein [Streptomyces flavidovirens]|uniref:hypothetical protein n=1 Tax=Streptomyces flavidovirens TaxID=67298 RepID=UPI00048FFA34|nr:hypothetical protein [Streptomyces flavidovirens]